METLNRISEKFRRRDSIQVQELINEGDAQEDNYLKNTSPNRSSTDVLFLVLQGVLLFILVFVIGYSIAIGDVDRLTKGHDDCGNVCGKKNSFDIKFQEECKAQDMTLKPILFINGNHRECIEFCSDEHILKGHLCTAISNELVTDDQKIEAVISGFFKSLSRFLCEIIYLSVTALILAFTILLMLRYWTAFFVWFVMLAMLLLFVLGATFFGHLASRAESEAEKDSEVRLTITFGVFAFVMLLIIFVMRKRIQLLIQLFKEAGKSILTMPVLLFEPALTLASLAITWTAWLYFSLWIESTGTPQELFGKVTFQPTTFTIIADLYNFFMMLWMVQFICGCQNMLIGGAISTWYFTRNKSKLGRPLYNSASNMIRYHLGTISVTSLIITAIQFVRLLVLMLRRASRGAVCIANCLNYVEQWIRYFTRNACIITAMHGYPFRKAGSRAFKLIVNNVMQIIAINSVGDFVLSMAKVLVAASTMGIGYIMLRGRADLDYQWGILLLVGFMAFMIAHCFFSVYEVAIDTIFICFCEDREVNDGILRPYYMSHELMEFVEKSNIVFITIKNNNKGSTNKAITHDQAGDKQFIVLLVVDIMAYMIADCFFSVYEVAINTIFICFCEDREVNDGVSRPYFMPDELMEFAEKSKHILKLDANHIALVNTALSKIQKTH